MRLEQTQYDNSETGCCAPLDPELWDGQRFEWHEKLFLKDHVRSVLHIPLNYGSVMSRDHALVQAAEAYPEQPMWLTDEVSPWGADIYVALDRPVPGAEMVKLSGRIVSRVFEGPYRHAGKWAQMVTDDVTASGLALDKIWFFYAACPKCARHFGKNHTVVFAQVH